MRVIVTRPAAQAAEWVARLAEAGIEAVALPLIGIEPVADAEPLRAAWSALARYRLVVFVSPNAALQFFAARPVGGPAWPPGTWAASPGPGTSRALRAAGVPPATIVEPDADAAAFDSESLWAALRESLAAPRSPRGGVSGATADGAEPARTGGWRGAQVLVVRGGSGRDWLAERLREAGATIELLCAYRRGVPRLDGPEREQLQSALAAPAGHLWFFSSSEAVQHLGRLAAPFDGWAAARALATHPRIAATARELGIGEVREARPTPDAVVACLQSFRP